MDIEEKLFKMAFLSFIKPGISPFLIFLLFVIMFYPLLIYTYGTEKQLGAWLVAAVWILFTGISPLILQINYFMNDRHKHLIINNSKRFLILKEGKIKQKIQYKEIERIVKYHSKNSKEGFVPRMHWHTYYYYKIIIKDKEPVYISRMIVERFEEKIEEINFNFIRVAYPFIREK